MNILAIESSCDETAAAIVKDGRQILSSVLFSQITLHKIYGGVVPEIASRCHIEKISPLCEQAIKQSGINQKDIDAVAVTCAPGLIGALLVGLSFAKGYSYANKLPLIPVHHIRAHVAANYLSHPTLTPPFLAMIVSGGHSHIVLVKDYTNYEILGMTKDDAAGEAFDKAARAMGLDYPGGVHMDNLAKNGERSAFNFPRVHFKDSPYDFSFSGVKTSMINLLHTHEQKGKIINKANVAAAYTDAITDVLVDHFIKAADDYGCDTLVAAGGVCANSMLRSKLLKSAGKRRLFMPPLSLCGDNAAMIGSQGYYEYIAGYLAEINQNAYPTMAINSALCKQKIAKKN